MTRPLTLKEVKQATIDWEENGLASNPEIVTRLLETARLALKVVRAGKLLERKGLSCHCETGYVCIACDFKRALKSAGGGE
jgi:hypothetical protein